MQFTTVHDLIDNQAFAKRSRRRYSRPRSHTVNFQASSNLAAILCIDWTETFSLRAGNREKEYTITEIKESLD